MVASVVEDAAERLASMPSSVPRKQRRAVQAQRAKHAAAVHALRAELLEARTRGKAAAEATRAAQLSAYDQQRKAELAVYERLRRAEHPPAARLQAEPARDPVLARSPEPAAPEPTTPASLVTSFSEQQLRSVRHRRRIKTKRSLGVENDGEPDLGA